MKIESPGRFAMLRRTLLELPPGRALQVACGAGCLWLTLDHELRDIVLERGESFTVARGRRALVYALEDAVLELAVAAERPQPAKIVHSGPALQAQPA